MLAAVGESGLEVGARLPLDGDNVSALVRRNGRAVRVDDYARVAGRVAARLRASDLRSGIGAPILVDGVLWGAMATSWSSCPPPAGVESRVAQFTELVATAIANAASRAALIASRARIVATADDTRRRIERDLHDGAQQRLVALQLELRAAEAGLPESLSELRAQLAAITERMTAVVDEVQEISRGIHPAILSTGGLGPALRTLTGLAAVPVELEVDLSGPLPSAVEVAAYYVVSEALTNAAKHARASVVLVEVRSGDAAIEVRIRDDGDGGADPAGGSGLVGLRDRVEALGGVLGIVSPRGGGTRIAVTIPIA
jgi:signal transduction histidine kinase